MPIDIRKKVHDWTTKGARLIDYASYALFNTYKFKPFPSKIERILVVELLKIGDLIVTTPVLRALKETYPQAEIDILVDPSMTEVLKHNPNIKSILPYKVDHQTTSLLRQRNYDLGVILHTGSFQVSKVLLDAKVKYRVGCAPAGLTYGKGRFLNKKVQPSCRTQHKIQDNLDVLRSIGIAPASTHVEVHTTNQAKQKAKLLLKGKKKPIIGIASASQHWTQRWYPERFAEVANYYIAKKGATIVFLGTKEERDQIKKIIQHIKIKKNIVDLCGKTTLHDLMAVIQQLDLLVCIDSAPLHIASAYNTPTIALFGPTMPAFWGPSGKKSTYIWKEKEACVGCRRYTCVFNKGHECMKSIHPSEVIQKSATILR